MVKAQKTSSDRKQKTGKKNRLALAFKQAPWRNHVQLVGGFLLALVIIILVASIYLSISGEAATAGLEAYQMDLERLRIEREIANTKANIAFLTSASNMEARARAMGFERIDPANTLYLTIPGYPGKQTMVVTSPPGIDHTDRLLVKSIYRESLWDWLFTGINSLSETVIGSGK
jgi:hypothetical protein